MEENPVIYASRKQLLAEYQKLNTTFVATTRPYKSTVYFPWEVVNSGNGVAFAVLRAQTVREFFSYGKDDQITIAPGITKQATASDTNLSRGRRTNGVEDFSIEGISATAKELRIVYADADVPAQAADIDVKASFKGGRAIADPNLIMSPPQQSSPLMFESVLYEALKPNVAIDFVWDQRNFIPIGTLDQIPEGGAKSYLHASGTPATDNRYKIPEGYIWRRTDKPDGDFVVRASVTDSVVVPISLVVLPGGQAEATPQYLVQAVSMRLHGLGLGQPGTNVG